jgi:anti-sigma28 factor (negative regulator of flagellin synthesis)
MPKIKNPKVAEIKKAIKNGTYDCKKAIEHTAKRIVEYPQSLLWK